MHMALSVCTAPPPIVGQRHIGPRVQGYLDLEFSPCVSVGLFLIRLQNRVCMSCHQSIRPLFLYNDTRPWHVELPKHQSEIKKKTQNVKTPICQRGSPLFHHHQWNNWWPRRQQICCRSLVLHLVCPLSSLQSPLECRKPSPSDLRVLCSVHTIHAGLMSVCIYYIHIYIYILIYLYIYYICTFYRVYMCMWRYWQFKHAERMPPFLEHVLIICCVSRSFPSATSHSVGTYKFDIAPMSLIWENISEPSTPSCCGDFRFFLVFWETLLSIHSKLSWVQDLCGARYLKMAFCKSQASPISHISHPYTQQPAVKTKQMLLRWWKQNDLQ